MADETILLAPGLTVNGFTLGERLFSGGMGSIWKATRPEPGPPLVLKIPFIAPGEDVSAIVAYEVEEMVMKRLAGPHAPKFIASGDLARLPYIAMEFVEGPSLESFTLKAPLPASDVIWLGRLIARAIANLHRQHVIHLDLKPANVIVAGRGAVLIDFGLAHHDDLPDLLSEESALPMGSAAYMAPEQIFGVRTQPASDQFALGVILYELATGKLPFGAPRTRAGLKQRVNVHPADLMPPLKTLPPGLAEVIMRAMEIDPARRYPTVDQMLFDLNHLDQVVVTDRARRSRAGGWLRRFASLFGSDPSASGGYRPARVEQRIASAPVIMAAVDLSNGVDALAELVRLYARREFQAEAQARLVCVTVLKSKLVAEDEALDKEGRPAYLGRLVALKDWGRSFNLGEETLSFHVLEGIDVAGMLLTYARNNRIDHIVMGARSASALRRHLGSVSAKVVAEAHCTVTVVRLPHGHLDAEAALESGDEQANEI